MKPLYRALALAILLGSLGTPAIAQEASSDPVQVTVGGRVQSDLSFALRREPFAGLFGPHENGLEIRRARLHAEGTLHDSVEIKLELDFAGGEVVAKDIYGGIRGLPVSVRFGHMKEPFSLEELISSRFITFMERSLVNSLAPSRNTGLQISGRAGSRTRWWAGAFRDSDGFAATPGDNYNLTTRLTHELVRDGDRLVHLGIALQHREIDGVLSLSARPGDHTAPKVLSASLPADGAEAIGIEAAATFGPLALQGEYVSSWVDSDSAGDPRLEAYYIQASYFLTGESRPYAAGRFDRPRPTRDLLDDGGAGAWQLAVRYSRLDLAEALDAGVLENLTVGLNWYWNPQVRLAINYESADRPDLMTAGASVIHTRFMFDF